MDTINAPGSGPAGGRGLLADHLRSFITLLVVAHHAVLAYHAYGPQPAASFDAAPMAWRAFPVLDAAKWPGIDLLVTLNDTFFMMLMFFVGGLYVARSVARRGAAGFVRERMLRLGLPFLASCLVLAPLAYYPAYLQLGGEPTLAAYARAYAHLPVWPAGPAWFLWVLFAFGSLAALALRAFPRAFDALAHLAGRLGARPSRFAVAFALACIAAYVPAAQFAGGMTWAEWGPFTVQTARIGQYALYFLVGIAVGAHGIERGLLAPGGALARRWKRWSAIAAIPFIVFVALVIVLFAGLGAGKPPGIALIVAVDTAFAVTGVFTSLAVLAGFARFAGNWTGRAWASLDRNAFGIYLLHYAFVAWLQYDLLDANLPGYAKGLLVMGGALALSWATSAVLRRIPGVARVIGDGATPRARPRAAGIPPARGAQAQAGRGASG
jgi:fucose 4-O-acetylase-like acetyltransferase